MSRASLQPSDRNSRVICHVALSGTYVIIVAAATLLCIRLLMNFTPAALSRLGICVVAFAYIIGTQLLVRRGHYRTVAYLILAFYTILATGIVGTWGINTPLGPLLFGLVVVLAGILLTTRHALYMAGVTCAILLILQTSQAIGWHEPNTSWTIHAGNSSYADVLAYGTVYGMLALASWLYNREMERSLTQARRAEKALLRQKATLELQVQRRTKQLRDSQLEELQQMYRVTELGQIGISLLHDLANNLTALQLEIEELEGERKSNNSDHARQITHYLSDIVDSTRSRIHGVPSKRMFNIIKKTDETVAFLRYKATKAHVDIDWQHPAKNWRYHADPVSYSQVLTLLISNAIDAYETSPPHTRRQVALSMQKTSDAIVVTIGSWSKIDKHMRSKLFKPFNSSKRTGMGLGLYIAKQTIAGQLGGTLTLKSSNHYTEFIISLPVQKDT